MTSKNTVKADYLVATVLLSSVDEQTLDTLARETIEGEYTKLYGYKGFVKDRLFVGDNGERMLIQATGSRADSAIDYIKTGWSGLSVARIDLQMTVLVPDADSVIRGTMPPASYKSVRMVNLNERGSTLYVGSPKSRCRLRMYNKTAEAGEERVLGKEKLRIEVQFRDEYADRALVNIMAGTADMFFRFYVSRMTDGYITSIVDKALADSSMLFMTEVETRKSEDTRIEWIEHSVMPALSKLSVSNPSYFKNLVEKLQKMIDN